LQEECIYIYISEKGKNLTSKTMNERKNPNYVYQKYHTCRKGKKERKKEKEKQHRDIHIYEKRKEK
jgi:hypothetical protein